MENLNLVTGIGKLQLRKQGIVGYFERATLQYKQKANNKKRKKKHQLNTQPAHPVLSLFYSFTGSRNSEHPFRSCYETGGNQGKSCQ